MAQDEQERLLSGTPTSSRQKDTTLVRYRSSKAFVLTTVCIALFTDSFVYGVLVPVFPALLKGRCKVQPGTEQLWTSALFAAFGITILIASPLCGYTADRTTSRRTPLLLALPFLAGATILIGASANVWVLVLSMILHGISTAITWTVGLALTRDTAGKREVGQWMGTALSASSGGLIVSPLLGGVVFDRIGIWGVLGMMGLLVVVNMGMIGGMVERHTLLGLHEEVNTGTAADEEDADDGSEAYGTFLPTTTNSSSSPTPTPNTSATLPEERKKLKPPLLLLLSSPRVLTGVYGVFTQFGLLASFDAFLPLYVGRHFGWGSLGAGLIFLNIAIPATLGPLAGKLSDRYGSRRVALAGCVLTAPPLFAIRFVGYALPGEGQGQGQGQGQIVLLCILLALAGLFLTLIISPLAADLSFAVDQIEEDSPGCFGEKGAYAQAYALFNCSMAAATVVGPLLAGGVQSAFGAKGVSLSLAVWCFSAGVPVLFFIGDGAPNAKGVEQTPVPRRLSMSA